MTFKSPIWQPVAVLLSAVNLVGVGFAAGAAEPWHAGIHAALALGFGLWAQRLRRVPSVLPDDDRIAVLEGDVSDMRRELAEAQERLDFAERLLAQAPDARRVGPER